MAADGSTDNIPYWGRDLARRVENIERLEPAVIAERVSALSKDVRSLKTAFYTFAFSVAASAILFAFSVFTLLGGSHS